MQRCVMCKEKFSYKTIILALWLSWTYKDIKCPHCHMVHSIKRSSRLLISGLITWPFLLLNFDLSILGAYLIYIVLLSLVTPFIARYN